MNRAIRVDIDGFLFPCGVPGSDVKDVRSEGAYYARPVGRFMLLSACREAALTSRQDIRRSDLFRSEASRHRVAADEVPAKEVKFRDVTWVGEADGEFFHRQEGPREFANEVLEGCFAANDADFQRYFGRVGVHVYGLDVGHFVVIGRSGVLSFTFVMSSVPYDEGSLLNFHGRLRVMTNKRYLRGEYGCLFHVVYKVIVGGGAFPLIKQDLRFGRAARDVRGRYEAIMYE